MNDMSKVITAKSDQMNSDDLISGPQTIVITSVDIRAGQDQPVSVYYHGDGGKPFKACKSMCRVMVAAWGPDAKLYVGRSMTLYRDPTVKWGGMEVGGIRISHMSEMDKTLVMALTASKGSRKPYTVKTLVVAQQAPAQPPIDEQQIIDDARRAAFEGMASYQAFYEMKTVAARHILVSGGHHEANKIAARQADKATDDFPGDAI